ncbi:MAG: primary-amine oxidase, partial [Gemmatimonadales bacterium]
ASVGQPREVPGPMRVDQPLGPGFRLDGHLVEWQKWRFHVRFERRPGTVISLVTYDHRSVLYQGSLAEVFVP